MSITMIRHANLMTATEWSPTGAKIGHDIIPTPRETAAVDLAAKMIVMNALFPSAQHPVIAVLRVLERSQ